MVIIRGRYSFCLLSYQVEELRNQNYVGRLTFAESFLKGNFSGSKVTNGLVSCSYSSGSITTLKNFMKEISIIGNKCLIVEDIDLFADNTQEKGRTSRVKENAITLIEIAANVVFIKSDSNTYIQKVTKLSPIEWL